MDVAIMILNAWIFNNVTLNPNPMFSEYVVPKHPWEILRFSEGQLINYSITSNTIKLTEVLKIWSSFN